MLATRSGYVAAISTARTAPEWWPMIWTFDPCAAFALEDVEKTPMVSSAEMQTDVYHAVPRLVISVIRIGVGSKLDPNPGMSGA